MDLILNNFNNIGNAIGWALIHFIWQGSLLFLTYWLISRLFLNNKIKTKYWIGMLFIAMCLIIPIREFYNHLNTTASYSNALLYQIGIDINPIESTGILSPFDLIVSLIQKIIPYLVMIWIFSVLLISTHLLKSWMFLVKLGKDTSFKLPDYLSTKLKKASIKLKLKFKPIISISKMIDVPATFGFFKPVILLPTSIIAKLPQEQMEIILLHELCHIKRADFLHNILQLLVETLFFYHPLVKWISKDVRKVREQCCDELVLEINDNPLIYAKALTNIASIYNNNINNRNTTSHIQIAASDGELFQRIRFLMLEKRSKSQFANIFIGLFITIFALIIFNNIINVKSNHSFTSKSLIQQSESNSNSQLLNRPSYSITGINQILNNSNSAVSNPEQSKILLKQNTAAEKSIVHPKQTSTHDSVQVIQTIKPQENTSKAPIENADEAIIDLGLNNNSNPIQSTDSIAKKEIINSFPQLIYKSNPIYPRNARTRGIEGTVILSFNIDRNGRVKRIKVDKSSPLKLLDGSARLALHKWRFNPKTINEHNLNNRYQQIFSYDLSTTDQCVSGDIGTRLLSQPLCQEL